IEQNIGLKAHIQRVMPRFLTLRDGEGNGLITAMLPPAGQDERGFRPIIVGPSNSDPYPEHGDAIRTLAAYYGLTLDQARCYPYRRGWGGKPSTGQKRRQHPRWPPPPFLRTPGPPAPPPPYSEARAAFPPPPAHARAPPAPPPPNTH